MRRHWLLAVAIPPLLSSCGPPDTRALKKLACEQAAASLDMQSVAQLDTLRKALGVAPGVDPMQECRSLGAVMDPGPGRIAPSKAGTPATTEGEQEGEQTKERTDER